MASDGSAIASTTSVLEEAVLRCFLKYLKEPSDINFQKILSSIEDSEVFKEIKISWRDPENLRGNLQNLIRRDLETWVHFWREIVRRSPRGLRCKFKAISPFAQNVLVRVKTDQLGRVSFNGKDLGLLLLLLMKGNGTKFPPGSDFEVIVGLSLKDIFEFGDLDRRTK